MAIVTAQARRARPARQPVPPQRAARLPLARLLRMIAMLPLAVPVPRRFGGVRRADRAPSLGGDDDLRAVAQTVGAVDHDAIARRDPR